MRHSRYPLKQSARQDAVRLLEPLRAAWRAPHGKVIDKYGGAGGTTWLRSRDADEEPARCSCGPVHANYFSDRECNRESANR